MLQLQNYTFCTSDKKPHGRDPAEMFPLTQNPKTMTVSIVVLVVIFAFFVGQ